MRCSSGTYIRAIARDLGAALGVGGHLTALRRTAVGSFDLAAARTLEQLADDFAAVPIADAARASFPVVELDEEQAAHVRFGRALDLALPGDGPHAVFAPDGAVPRALRAARRAGPLGRRLRRLTGHPTVRAQAWR